MSKVLSIQEELIKRIKSRQSTGTLVQENKLKIHCSPEYSINSSNYLNLGQQVNKFKGNFIVLDVIPEKNEKNKSCNTSSPLLFFGFRKKNPPKPIILKAKTEINMSQNEECLAEENNYNKVQFRFARNFDEVKMDDKSGLEGSIINHNQSEEKKEILKVEDSTILTNMYTNSNLKNLNTNP